MTGEVRKEYKFRISLRKANCDCKTGMIEYFYYTKYHDEAP